MISTVAGKKQVPLMQWMKDVKNHLESFGMDAVFYAINPKSNQPVNLLDKWSLMTTSEVATWYVNETWDAYDKDNLRMSGIFI